jgi:hypothetical protein
MTTDQLLEKLTDAAERMGLKVRTEKGNFDGGRCRMGGEEVVMLNERDLPERRLAVLARAVRPEEMEAVYLTPAVRKRLHEIWQEEQARADEPPSAEQDAPDETPAHAD